jgi:hypothetical protein
MLKESNRCEWCAREMQKNRRSMPGIAIKAIRHRKARVEYLVAAGNED